MTQAQPRWDHDPGAQAVRAIYEAMNIDAEWCVRDGRSFSWWGHRQAQRVWAEPATRSYDMDVYRVHAQTDLLRDVPDSPRTREVLAGLNGFADLSALMYAPKTGSVTLHCNGIVHFQNPWVVHLLKTATAVQADIAANAVDFYQAALMGAPDTSDHPTNGRRPEPDDMLSVVETFFQPNGVTPSRVGKDDFEETLADNPHIWTLGNAGRTGLTVEFPYTGTQPAALSFFRRGRPTPVRTALFQADLTEPHPRLGAGILFRLSLPDTLSGGHLHERVADLNQRQAFAWLGPHALGAWCAAPDNSALTHVAFLPNAAYQPGLIWVFLEAAALRTRFAREVLQPS